MSKWKSQFLEFHRKNPQVYARALELCQEMWNRGYRKYAIKTIMEHLRYEFDLHTGGEEIDVVGGERITVKMNNNYFSYYARLIAYKNPELEYFFSYRRVEGEEDGEVVLFSDIPGEPSFVLGHRPPRRRRPRRPPPRRRKR